jgi:TonB-linked SusC/RagA family outer membrane protein
MRKSMLTAFAVFAVFLQVLAQRAVTGKVTDEKGAPVSGASVVARGNVGTTTAENGAFTIQVPANVRTLTVSSINFETQTVTIGTGPIVVVLKSDGKTLNDVVVTGYGTKKRTEYGGAATKVMSENIRQVPIASFDQILQGQVPGLSVLSGSGQPGASASVILRGATSIIGSNSPLYVIDGVPVEASVFQSINPNAFESVDVLKDAVAAAQYGSRGASGVIVATTKRGKGGKTQVSFSYQAGRKFKPVFNYDMMNSAELLKAQEELGQLLPASANNINVPGFYYSPLSAAYAAQNAAGKAQFTRTLDSLRGINNNWDDNFFRNGRFNNYDLSISGGQGRTRFYSAIGLYKEEGVIRRSDLKRVTLNNNIDFSDDKINLRLTTAFGYSKRNFQESSTSNSVFNPFLSSRITAPYYTPKDRNGNPNFNGNSLSAYGPYLIDAMEINGNYNDQIKATVGLTTNYRITKDITLGAFGSIDFRETQGTVFNSPLTVNNRLLNTNVRTRTGSLTESLERTLQLNGRLNASYDKVFNEKHGVGVSAFYETLQTFYKFNSQQGFNLDPRRPNTFAGVGPVNTGNAVNFFPAVTGSRSRRALESVGGAARYSYNKKYTVNFSYRQDGSSQLPEKNRWQGFYAGDVIWELTQEKFLAKSKKVDLLRLRASYGRSANAENFPYGYFGYLETYSSGIYVGGPGDVNQTIFVTNPGNIEAVWEYTKTLNIGIDYSFFKRRVYGDINVYDKRTDNAFARQSISPAASSFTTLDVNSGLVGNKGIELTLNVEVLRKKDFSWVVGINSAYNKNEVLDLGDISTFEQGTSRITKGLPLGSHFEQGWAGVDAATGKPLYYDVNGNVTDVYNLPNKVQKWGTFYAPYTGGFNSRITYKGFDLSVLFSYQYGSTRVNNLEFFVENPGGFLLQGFNQARSLDYWKKPGDQPRVQSPLFQNNFTSKYIQDASFLRLRNLTLAYTVPDNIISKVKLAGARFFITGQNLAVWTKWKGYDPEDDNNISLSEFPNPRAFTAGVDITF